MLFTETASARTLLEQHLGQLRVALEAQGLSVERLNVHTMSSPMNQGPHQQASQDTPQEGRSRGSFAGHGEQQRGDGQPGRGGQPSKRQEVFEQLLMNEAA